MFKFDFDIPDALDDTNEVLNIAPNNPQESKKELFQAARAELEPFAELPLADLLDALPNVISYSPLTVPLSSPRKSITLLRRDLFDARFQLISEGAGDAEDLEDTPNIPKKKALEFLDNPSDLVPGVYEGGLKTWECSLDLVDYLDSIHHKSSCSLRGKNILELGCGTGVPSAFVLHELLSSQTTTLKVDGESHPETFIHLQDYNSSVLQLVTLPNLLLAWYSSPRSSRYQATCDDLPSTSEPGELPLTPELKSAFIESLKSCKISLRFFSGSWETFEPCTSTTEPGSTYYDLLLTSETIYRVESLPTLIGLMQKSCIGSRSAIRDLQDLTSKLHIMDPDTAQRPSNYLCLVAAKVLYFGVGGGVPDFVDAVHNAGGQVETVLEKKVGVGRKIMSVYW